MFHGVEQTTTERTAAAVRAELARRKISGKKLAEDLGWSRTTTWRRLNGTYPFDVDQLDAIASHLGVSVGTFLSSQDAA